MTAAVSAVLIFLLAAAVFAGVVSAAEYAVTDWNNQTITNKSGIFLNGNPLEDGDILNVIGSSGYLIKPKNIGGEFDNGAGLILPNNQFNVTENLTLDFSDYTGSFEGYDSDEYFASALFGAVNIADGKTLTIRGLTMTGVTVTSSAPMAGYRGARSFGGIVGYAYGDGALNITDCHLQTCQIAATGEFSNSVGGMVGSADDNAVVLNFADCEVVNCSISAGRSDGGGLVGRADSASFANCEVSDCSISAEDGYIGGLVGVINSWDKAGSSCTVTNCMVTNCVISAGRMVGGLVGYSQNSRAFSIENCEVVNCIVTATYADGSNVGGLVGYSSGDANFADCIAANCSISADSKVGGLVGYSVNSFLLDLADCEVVNCSISADSKVGGLVGECGPSNYTGCSVTDSSISATIHSVGGLVGQAAGSAFARCTVTNCIVSTCDASFYYSAVGGLVGYLFSANFTDCSVVDCTVAATDAGSLGIGGLVGISEMSDIIAGGNWLNSSAILGDLHPTYGQTVGEVVGFDIAASSAKNISNYYPKVQRYGPIYLNMNNNATNPKITIVPDSNDLPSGNTTITKLTGIGFKDAPYNAISFVNVASSYTVTFYNETSVVYYSESVFYSSPVEKPVDLTKTGYTFNGWNQTDASGEPYVFSTPVTADLDLFANWTVYSTTNSSLADIGSAKIAAFNDDGNVVKIVAIQNSTTAVTAVTVTYEPNTAGPSSDGSYNRHVLTPVFNITLTGNLGSDNATVVFNLTTAELNGASPDDIYLAHKKNGAWEYLKPNYVQTGDVYTFTAAGITSFSPFVPISMTAIPQPVPQSRSSGSSSSGNEYSVLMTATPVPTPTPTAVPTQAVPTVSPVKPQPTQTSASPAPFIGILAGLGAAAVFFGLRRT